MLNGKARTMGLGAFGDQADGVTLADARERAATARSLVKQGVDPVEARQAEIIAKAGEKALSIELPKTFAEAASEYISAQEAGWTNAKHRAQWTSTLKTYAYPIMGTKPVSDITADLVEQVLKPIWAEKNETATRLRGRIEAVLDFTKAKGWRSGDNPARWKESLKHRLPNISRVRRTNHHPSLPWQMVPAFMAALCQMDSISSRALQFVILNASRSGEVRGARWREFDLDHAIWTIPAKRMKTKREQRVPLSDAAIAVLKSMQPLGRGPNSLVFPSIRQAAALSDMALSELIRGMNKVKEGEIPPWRAQDDRPIVVHGFRSSFRDWCEEATSTPHAVSEAALAHVVSNKVEAAYRRTDLFDKRRILMQQWSEHCIGMK